MVRYKIRQNRGSSLAEIMTKINKPVNNTAKYLDILSAHIEPFELDEEYISSDMERGNSLEPIARMEFERVYSKKVRQVGWVEMDNGNIRNFTGRIN